MPFTEPEIVEGWAYVIETDDGTEFLPADTVCLPIRDGETMERNEDDADWQYVAESLSDYVAGSTIYSVALRRGILVRMSAPGYLDCTPWVLYGTMAEALLDLRDMS
jgi:hypothetical protein